MRRVYCFFTDDQRRNEYGKFDIIPSFASSPIYLGSVGVFKHAILAAGERVWPGWQDRRTAFHGRINDISFLGQCTVFEYIPGGVHIGAAGMFPLGRGNFAAGFVVQFFIFY